MVVLDCRKRGNLSLPSKPVCTHWQGHPPSSVCTGNITSHYPDFDRHGRVVRRQRGGREEGQICEDRMWDWRKGNLDEKNWVSTDGNRLIGILTAAAPVWRQMWTHMRTVISLNKPWTRMLFGVCIKYMEQQNSYLASSSVITKMHYLPMQMHTFAK